MQQQIQIIKPQFTQVRDNLDIYVGFVTPLNSPFNFFIRNKDLKMDDNMLYFYSYSMGKNKVVIWGVYDPDTEEFLIDNNCKYNVSQMKEIVDNINSNGYEYKFSDSKNRILKSMTFSNMNVSRKYGTELYNKFKSYFVSNLVRYEYIKSTDVSDVTLTEDIDDIDNVINEIISLGRKIDNRVDYKSITSEYSNKQTISKYLSINNYILALLTDDEYRTLKFINYFYKNTTDDDKSKELKNYFGGKFIMIWLEDLVRALKIKDFDQDNFILDFTNIMVKYYENNVNIENIGVIGGFRISEDEQIILRDLSNKFNDFITKSIYSKDTYANNLTPCPSKESCGSRDGKCGLWNHGYNTQSGHDLR